MHATEMKSEKANPLLAPWTGPYGGVPPFDQAKVEHLKPALEAGMAENLAEVDRIAANPEPATFENTIAALERTGRTLDRVGTIYGIYASTLNDDAVQAVEREMEPKLAAFNDQITQNEALFKRIEAVYEAREKSDLSVESMPGPLNPRADPGRNRLDGLFGGLLGWIAHGFSPLAGPRLEARRVRCKLSMQGSVL